MTREGREKEKSSDVKEKRMRTRIRNLEDDIRSFLVLRYGAGCTIFRHSIDQLWTHLYSHFGTCELGHIQLLYQHHSR